MALQSSWDNTTLFVDDDPADRAFRQEVRDWITQNLLVELATGRMIRPSSPWHRKFTNAAGSPPPRDHGGMGATLTQQIILFDEISRVGAPPHPHGLNFIGP